MVTIKNPEEIKLLRQSGRILASVLNELVEAAKPGATTRELDQLAIDLITSAGGRPSFQGYCGSREEKPFPSALCASVNEELVHAPAAPGHTLRSGDIVGLDLGVDYKGFFTDMTITALVGNVSKEARDLVKVTKKSLDKGLEKIKEGNYISDISRAIQKYVEDHGYSVIRQLVGHGVGYKVHEEPSIPNFIAPGQPKIELKAGMVLAIEPMVAVGDWRVKTLSDGWTVMMADGGLAAHFEHTVVVTKNGYELLTQE
jgi:methionyl aminopeptidase